MHKCILCSNSTSNSAEIPHVTYHSFPRNLLRRNQWVEHLKVGKCFDWQRICSDHFTENDFKPGEKRLLRRNALPKLPSNEIHENKETFESEDINLVNNTRNKFCSPRRSSRKIKKSRQLLENETNKKVRKTSTPTDSRIRTPMSYSNSNKKVKKEKEKGFIGLRYFRCTVKGCNNSYPNSNVSFFTYPDNSLRDIWIDNCGTREILEAARSKKKKHLKVCGKHFEKSMFMNPKKKNRLKPNAVPTLRINKEVVSNTPQSANFENNDVESTSVEESSSNEYLIQPSVELDENMINEANMDINTKILEICCIPECISNFAEENMIPELIFLFSPPIEDVNKWSSMLGIPLTESSRVCEHHFKPQDFTDEKTLIPGAVPSIIKPLPYKGELNPSVNEKNKNKIHNAIDGSKKLLNYVDSTIDIDHSPLKLDEDRFSTDTIPQSIVNSAEIDANSILKPSSETRTEPIPLAPLSNESRSRIEKVLSKMCNTSVPVSNPTHNEHSSVISIMDVGNNSTLKQSSVTRAEPSTTSADVSRSRIEKRFSNNSVSITMESSDEKNKQILPLNSSEVINPTDIFKQTLITKSTSILSKVSINNSTPNTSQSNLMKILPKTFTNGSISITLKPNIKENKKSSEIDSTDILKPTSLTNNCMSNSIESAFEDPILKNLVNNNSVSITRETNYKPKKLISTINSTDIFKSPSVSIQSLKTKSGPSDVLPTTLTDDDLTDDSSLENGSLSEVLSSDELSSSQDPVLKLNVSQLDIAQIAKKIKLEPIDDDEFLTISTDNISMLNSEASIGTIDNNNENLVQTTLIRDISKTILLPNMYWRSLYHREQNNTVFIERNEVMEAVKKIYFKNSLVPIIYINNKRYEYNEAIGNKIALENLLIKIDNIQICSGYEGFVHDQCIGYLDDTSISNGFEVCSKCHQLVEKDCFQKFDRDISDIMISVQHFEKNSAERNQRILETKIRLQSKRKDPIHIYKSSNPVICER